MRRELKLRTVSGIVLAVVALVSAWLGGFVFAVLSIAIAFLVFFEWSRIAGLVDKDFEGTLLGWLALVVIAGLILFDEAGLTLPALLGFIAVSALWVLARGGSWWLVGGIAYAGLTAISLSGLRGDNDVGLIAIIFVFAVVWATDILAYFFGRAIGGPKLAPAISPGKTWSGAIGGTVCGVVAGTAVFLSHFSIDDIRIPLLALCLSVAGQIGDLFESYIKRRFGVKDSGGLIPGHGGVMDRVDGLVFACFAALLISLSQALATGDQNAAMGALLLGL